MAEKYKYNHRVEQGNRPGIYCPGPECDSEDYITIEKDKHLIDIRCTNCHSLWSWDTRDLSWVVDMDLSWVVYEEE